MVGRQIFTQQLSEGSGCYCVFAILSFRVWGASALVPEVLLHPGCPSAPSLLPAQEGWNALVAAHRISACCKVRTAACCQTWLQEHSLTPHSCPHSHYSGNFSGNWLEDPCNMDSICYGYRLLPTVPPPRTGTPPGPGTLAACLHTLCSLTTSNSSLSTYYTAKVLPGAGVQIPLPWCHYC